MRSDRQITMNMWKTCEPNDASQLLCKSTYIFSRDDVRLEINTDDNLIIESKKFFKADALLRPLYG